MAQHTINVSNEKAQDMVDCFGEGYQETIDGEENTQTKVEFAKEKLNEFISNRVRKWKRQKQTEALAAYDPEITVT